MSDAQEAIWNNVYSRVWLFLREVRQLDGGAKLTQAELDVTELEKLISAEAMRRDCYIDSDGISGVPLGSREARARCSGWGRKSESATRHGTARHPSLLM